MCVIRSWTDEEDEEGWGRGAIEGERPNAMHHVVEFAQHHERGEESCKEPWVLGSGVAFNGCGFDSQRNTGMWMRMRRNKARAEGKPRELTAPPAVSPKRLIFDYLLSIRMASGD